MYELYVGEPPFYSTNIIQLMTKVIKVNEYCIYQLVHGKAKGAAVPHYKVIIHSL